jgi:RNA polymerase sigma factor (sigma-70 family)
VKNRSSLDILPLLQAARVQNAGKTDGQLLDQFVTQRDEAAFEALVRRHGPMVLGVCRRILGNVADAEDAFQATFIVLLRKAASLTARSVLGDYLHGVAHRTALKARCAAARRRAMEQALPTTIARVGEDRNDWLPILDEELARLPEKYRLPMVLCDLEGKTRREAAGQLGWPEGTVAGRLARGRALLAKRLLRGAQVLSGGVPGVLLEGAAQAALPPGLVSSTVQAVASVVGGQGTAPAVLSTTALTLARGVMQTMFWNKIKIGVMVLLAAVVTTGVGGVIYRVVAGQGQTGVLGKEGQPPVPPKADKAPPKEKPPIVREIDLKGFKATTTNVSPEKPAPITSVKELEKAISDKEWQAKIAKQVDFAKEQLLFFAWLGSGGDKFGFTTQESKSGPVVVFRYLRGEEDDEVLHFRLYALSKETGWRVEIVKNPPPDDKVVREIDLNGFSARFPYNSFEKPTVITSVKELKQAISDKEWQAKIAKQVDFAKERLLYFTWSGGRRWEKLSFTVEEGPTVVFRHALGDEQADVPHFRQVVVGYFRLFALAKGASWRIQDEEKKSPPDKPPWPDKNDTIAKLLKDLESTDRFVRAAAIDLLGERKAKEAIPKLIDLVADSTGLVGSDNYVGAHAAAALSKITGQPFSIDQKEWKTWWQAQKKEAEGPKEKLMVGSPSSVKVLNAEAVVELRGVLCHTPKGVFLMVREERKVQSDLGWDTTELKVEVATWELDLSKAPELENQAKSLSGKAVLVTGTCKMIRAQPGSPIVFPDQQGGWAMQRIVTVSRLTATEK